MFVQALDAAIRRHDPHALDALLMQFAAVIVSTTGAEVDRMEREIMVSCRHKLHTSIQDKSCGNQSPCSAALMPKTLFASSTHKAHESANSIMPTT